jgi:hypothetical protein
MTIFAASVQVDLMNCRRQDCTPEKYCCEQGVAVDIPGRVVEDGLVHPVGRVVGIHVEDETPTLVDPSMELLVPVLIVDLTVVEKELLRLPRDVETPE